MYSNSLASYPPFSLVFTSVKAGYPPRPLTLVPQLPVSSLGLAKGDQLILTASPAQPPVPGVPAAPPQSRDPAPISSSISKSSGSSTHEHVVTDAGFLVHRVVPDDNSCLFSSIALAFEQSISKASKIRQSALPFSYSSLTISTDLPLWHLM
jgi:ubiquitin thioesterase OTU1